MNKITVAAALMTIGVTSLIGGAGTANAGGDCYQRAVACGYTAPNKVFRGSGKPERQIRVTVCHSYWDRLDIGTLNGRKTKWWGPTMQFGSWRVDLPATGSECKTFWVVPGTEVDSYASCVKRIVRTGRMTKSGTYWLS